MPLVSERTDLVWHALNITDASFSFVKVLMVPPLFFISQDIHILPDDVPRHPAKRSGRPVGKKRKSTSSLSTTDEGELNKS